MKEYWVNVYPANQHAIHTRYAVKWPTREDAIMISEKMMCGVKCLYRIHVKMKESKYITGSEIVRNREVNLEELVKEIKRPSFKLGTCN